MAALYYILSWGSPVGIGAFLFLMSAGAGIFFWGVSHFMKSNNPENKTE